MYTKILVPLDGSKLAECVLPTVQWFAKVSHVQEILFMRVVEPLHVRDNLEKHFGPDERLRLEQDEINSAKTYCDSITVQFKDIGILISSSTPVGKPAETIIDYIKKDKDLDLIIMATHGRSGVGQLLHGSTADRVVHDTTVPVLLVTPQTHAPE